MLIKELPRLFIVFLHYHIQEQLYKYWKQNLLQIFLILVQTLINVLLEQVIRFSVMRWRVTIEDTL